MTQSIPLLQRQNALEPDTGPRPMSPQLVPPSEQLPAIDVSVQPAGEEAGDLQIPFAMRPYPNVACNNSKSDGIYSTNEIPVDHESRLPKTATTAALEVDTNVDEQLGRGHPKGNKHNVVEYRERRPLLQTKLPLDSHEAPVSALRPDRKTAFTGSTQGKRSFSANVFFILRNWWKEWALVLFATSTLICITVVLRSYNQQPQPTWRLGLNINTLIAVLATLLRSSLVTVVEQIISQAKWYWQHRCRPAHHLAHFDEASRGPFGALMLCARIPALLNWNIKLSRYNSSAVVACSVTVLSLAVGAFTQQAIKTVPCSRAVAGVNASIPIATYAHPFMNDRGFASGSRDFDTQTKARIVSGLGSPSITRPAYLQGCTTGNCTFESLNGITHVTSGFCSRCIETTKYLVHQSNVSNYYKGVNNPIQSVVRLQSSPSLMLAFGLDHASRLGLAVNTDSNPLRNLSGSVPNNFTVAINVASVTRATCSPGSSCSGHWPQAPSHGWADGWSDLNVVSVSCGLYPCARHMKAEASNGQFSESVVREELYMANVNAIDSVFTNKNYSEPYTFYPPCWENNTRYDKRPTDTPVLIDMFNRVVQLPPCSYGVSQAFSSSISQFVSVLLPGNCSAYLDEGVDTVSCHTADASVDNSFCNSPETSSSPMCMTDSWWLANLYNSGNATLKSIAAVMDNLALAITDSARSQPYPSLSHVPGMVWESTVCTEFNWPWISFPATLIALTAIALASIASAAAPARDEPPIWKSSILPLVYGGQAIGSNGSVSNKTLRELEYNAKKDVLVLERGENGWKIIFPQKDE